MSSRRNAALLLACVALGSLVGTGCAGQRTNLPSVDLRRLDGRDWNLRDEAGNVVVLQFFATFDNSSMMLVNSLERIHILYRERGVSVIGVAMNPGEGRARRRIVETFCSFANLTFDVVLASDALGEGDTELERIPVIPATIVFNRRGDAAASATGVVREPELMALLDQLVR